MLSFHSLSFIEDERSQVLTLNVWVEQTWRDERISWDPQDYGNISKLTVGTQHLWIPDIVLYNKLVFPRKYGFKRNARNQSDFFLILYFFSYRNNIINYQLNYQFFVFITFEISISCIHSD